MSSDSQLDRWEMASRLWVRKVQIDTAEVSSETSYMKGEEQGILRIDLLIGEVVVDLFIVPDYLWVSLDKAHLRQL